MISGLYGSKLKRKIKSSIRKNFSWRRKGEEQNLSVSQQPARFKFLSKEDLSQTYVYFGHSVPAFPLERPRESIAMNIAGAVLGGDSMTSRLYKELREKKGLTYSVFASVDFGKRYGLFWFDGSVRTASTREFIETALVVLKAFYDKGVTLEELQRVKQILKSKHIKANETPEARLSRSAYYTTYLGLPNEFYDNYLDALESISLEEVNQAVKKYIFLKPLQVVVHGHPSLKSQLSGIKGLPPLKAVSFKERFKDELALASSILSN